MTLSTASPVRAAVPGVPVSRPTLLLLGMVAAGVAWHATRPVLPDIGWFAVLAGKLLDGARPYVDTIEVNLPASTLLYVPVVAAGRLTGWPLSILVALMMGCLAFASAWTVMRLAVDLKDRPPPLPLALALGFVLAIMPLGAWGQREHVAVCLMLPAIVSLARRAERLPGRWPVALGMAAGAALALKPHFALALAAPALWLAWQARSWRILIVPELAVAAVTGSVLLVATVAPHPLFLTHWLAVFDETYRANRLAWPLRLAEPGSLAFLVLALATVLLRPGPLAVLPRVLLLAAAGFWLTALEQGKMWENHQYPALALAVLAAAVVFGSREAGEPRRAAAIGAVLAAATAFGVVASRGADTTALAPLLRERAPAHPLLFQVGAGVAAGHPLAELVGARWANASTGALIWQFADHRLQTETLDPATRRRLEAYAAVDRERFRKDLLRQRPDALLIERTGFDWLAWAREDPAVAAVIDGYEKAGEAAGVELWLPKPPAQGARSAFARLDRE
jgi:hypothetical protein